MFYTHGEANKGRSSIDDARGVVEDELITILEGRVKTEEVTGRKDIREITVKAKISTQINKSYFCEDLLIRDISNVSGGVCTTKVQLAVHVYIRC